MALTAEDFLLGSGSKSAKFTDVGDTITGTVCAAPEVRQKTDIKDGTPLTWSDGTPQMQLVVKLQTDEREDADDDGVRAVYIAGGFKRASLQKAVADALRTAGAKSLEVGGKLAIKFTGEEPSQTRGFNPAKLYAAKYEPPAQKAADDFLAVPAAVQAIAAPADQWGNTATPPF